MNKDPIPSLDWVHPLVREWFLSEVGTPTEPQQQGWPPIVAGKHTLISAPTGSGKTLAAFLACIDGLVRKALAGTLEDKLEVLYISPLKALSHDVQKNLLAPLAQISKLAASKGLNMPEIRVAVRTGDTLATERQAMLRKPPHILVTTPESFYILLTAERSRAILTSVRTLIVDEIHALADDKRGAHLSLSVERLEAITEKKPIRIGLSATQKPIELVAQFLVGASRPKPRIIHIGHERHLDLAIEIPNSELGPVASNEMWDEIYDRLAALANEHRSTLIFVNTRRLAERVAHHLTERLGEEQVTAHHGSLSRKLRLAAEHKLKNGELKALVATASLELGIDIGSIDLVCQIGSPRSIAVALQRIGRAGHWHGAISKGRVFATTRDELLECAALVKAIREGDLDQLIIPEQPLDILAQQIVATCATNDWQEEDLFQLVKQSFPYKDLSREVFNDILVMLSEGIAGSRGRYGAYLFRDQVNGLVKARRGARLTAITSGGAIPDTGLFTMVAQPQGVTVGTLDEDFAVESNRGDIILLGSTSWMIQRVESAAGRVLVEDAHGAPPSVPFWRGEAPGRTQELSFHVGKLREAISDMRHSKEDAITWLQEKCGVDAMAADQLLAYISQGHAILGAVPTQSTIIAERFFDEGGGMQLIIHAPFGARINKAWGLALRKKFCRSFNFELQASATDDGINIALTEQHSFPLADVFRFLNPKTIKETLVQAVLQSPLFKTRFRWDASRALALVRFRHGKKVPPNIQRMRSDDLLAAVFPDAAACQDNLAGKDIELPNHPLINETMKDALHEAMDLDGFSLLLQKIYDGEVKCLAVDTPTPSPFAHEILNANPYAYLDDAPLEERRARAVEMRRILPETLLQEVGKLDPDMIAEVQTQAWPDIRNADELHDVLQTLIALPSERGMPWQNFFAELTATGRAGSATIAGKSFWLATEKAKTFSSIYPNAVIDQTLTAIEKDAPARETAITQLIRGWMFHLGPTTTSILSELLNLSRNEVDQALLYLESTGLILRGQFKTTEELEWCERRLLARIHKMTLGKLRKEIEPVTPAQFVNWLLKWQHLAPGTQLTGEKGLLEIIKQLQGFELPANAWEIQIFTKRMKDYDASLLDHLCLTGAVGWGRFSAPATAASGRVIPSSIAPITFFLREDAHWITIPQVTAEEAQLSPIAKSILEYLQQRGASFFVNIVRGVNHLKSEVETGLWELVKAGKITADGFDNLRALIEPKRRLGRKTKRGNRRYSASTGRWSLLQADETVTQAEQITAICWMLLHRYGVVFRDLVIREKNLPRWRELLVVFRRLEDSGEIRGGRFVSGFLGEQFALPYAVQSLRASKNELTEGMVATVSAADPLNLVGIIIPGTKVSAVSRKKVELQF